MLRIRPFLDSDYPAFLEIRRSLDRKADDESIESLKRRDDSGDSRLRHARVLAEMDSTPVGYGHYAQSAQDYHPRKFGLFVAVRPDFRKQGIGTKLYGEVLRMLAPFEPMSLRSFTFEDRPDAIRFLEKCGFVQNRRLRPSTLTLAGFHWNGGLDLPDYEILDWREATRNDSFARALYETETEALSDVPLPPDHERVSYEDYVRYQLSSPSIIREGSYFAVDRATGKAVGMSFLVRTELRGTVLTAMTGVRRAHRKKGLASRLKLRGILYAKENGFEKVITNNDDANAAIIALNDRLGFVPEPANLGFVKAL